MPLLTFSEQYANRSPIYTPIRQGPIGHVAVENNITCPGRGRSLGTGQL